MAQMLGSGWCRPPAGGQTNSVSIFDPASTFVTDDPINNGKSIYGSEML